MNHTTSRPWRISLVPVGRIRREALEILETRLPSKFGRASCRIEEISSDVGEFRNPRTGQYYATRILASLERNKQAIDADKVLAVTDLDLYVPNMNFVFGEARLPGEVAVISTHRLSGTTEYGGENLFASRVIKEAVHELGHTLGLTHCSSPSCVMYFSNSLSDTDRKGEEYCDNCTRKLSIGR